MARMRLKKTSAKGHKWKKGQSCLSNPQTNKHRQAARGCFFQRLDGTSNLTQAALAEHNDVMDGEKKLRFGRVKIDDDGDFDDDEGEEEDEEEVGKGGEMSEVERQMQELDVDAEDLASACGKTFNTFASNFSTCTLPAFEKFFRTFDSASDQHTRMLGIHAAAQEYLRETGTAETSTAYFCSLMVSLEGVIASEEDTAAALALLARVARRVARDVLRAKFAEFAASLSATLDRYQESANSRLLANGIGVLSILLRAQDRSEWANASTMALFNGLLGYTLHPKPKIRKAAQYNVSAILCGSSFILGQTSTNGGQTSTNGQREEASDEQDEEKVEENVEENANEAIEKRGIDGPTGMVTSAAAAAPRHPAAAAAAEFCLVNLRSSTELGNAKATLHTLVLLRQIIVSLPRKQLKAICECLLSLMQVGRALITTSALQALHALLAAHPPKEVLPPQTNAALIVALTQGATEARVPGGVPVPGKNDPQLAAAWITVVTVAVMNLCRLDESDGLQQLVVWFELLLPYWCSDHGTVLTKVRESLEVLLRECVGGVLSAGVSVAAGSTLWGVLCQALSLQYQGAWGEVFRVLEAAFPALAPAGPEAARPCLEALCRLMDNPRLPHRPGLERALGAAVGALGPGPLLALVPPLATGQVEKDEVSWWTLPLLRRSASGAGLAPFTAHLLPLAAQCHTLLARLDSATLLGRAYQQVEQQVWAALPTFCRGAKDAEEALCQEGFPRLLCDHIKHRPDTRIHVMEALRTLLALTPTPPRLALYAKNYLPALFNVYLTPPGTEGVTPGQRQAALATVRAFVSVLGPGRGGELLAMVLDRHTQARGAGRGQDQALRRRALLDLAAALLPSLDGTGLERLYGHVAPLLALSEHGQQKAAYRVLEATLALDTPAAKTLLECRQEELCRLLLEGLAQAAPSARAPRLRCLRLVLLGLEPGEGARGVVQRVVGEAVVCCGRGVSQATRRAAFLLLSDLCLLLQRCDDCTPQQAVPQCLELLLAGLAGSPALASATMLALTALAYQHRQHLTQQVASVLTHNACSLLLCPTREIVASALSFVKALPALLPPQRMAPLLPPLMTALANMTPDCQRKYRLKTRDILDRLIRRHGADAITALVPPGDSILHKRIKNLRKMAARKEREREERRKTEGEEEEEETRALPASLDEILAEIDSDDDKDDEDDGKKRKKKKKGRKIGNTFIKEDNEEIVDLLDSSAGQAIMSSQAASASARARSATRKGSSAAFEVDADSGKLIIVDDGKKETEDNDALDFSEDMDELLGLKAAAAGGKVKKRKRSDSLGSAEVGGSSGGGGGGGGKGAKRKRTEPGAEFRAKRAGGDVKKKGVDVNPYAYVRLSKEQLNRRKKAKFEGQFGSLVRGAKKGVRGGRRGLRGRVRKK